MVYCPNVVSFIKCAALGSNTINALSHIYNDQKKHNEALCQIQCFRDFLYGETSAHFGELPLLYLWFYLVILIECHNR